MMQSAMNMASIFGPFLLVLGIWKLFYHSNAMKVIASVKNSPASMYILGILNLLFGLTVLNQYNNWMWGLPLLVTILGWVLLIRGLLFYFMPHCLFHKNVTSGNAIKVKGVILLVWGFALCWFAFWM